MERWVPLFDILLNSPCPEGEASRWFRQQRYDQNFIQHQPPPPPQHLKPAHSHHPANAFLSLLLSPADVVVAGPVGGLTALSTSPNTTKRFLWIQTLPCAVQSRILSFLTIERWRFPEPLLHTLATTVLLDVDGNSSHEGPRHAQLELFWVAHAARNLLDSLSEENGSPEPGATDGNEEGDMDEFYSLPPWLKRAATSASASARPVLPWLPLSLRQVCRANHRVVATLHSSTSEVAEDSEATEAEGSARRDDDETMKEVAVSASTSKITIEAPRPPSPPPVAPTPDVLAGASALRAEISSPDSVCSAVRIANDVKQLCVGPGVFTPEAADYALHILTLIEPWRAEDETAAVLLSTILDSTTSNDSGGDSHWPGRVFSAVLLPKLIALEQPASRALLSSTLDFTKAHPRSTAPAVLLPLFHRKGGINPPLCDVLARVIKESLRHPQVSAFCHRLLCSNRSDGDFFLLACHRHSIVTQHLVWTESLFSLFQQLLAWGAALTPESVDKLVDAADGAASELTKSLRFGNFLLSLVTKSERAAEVHKDALLRVAEMTQTFVTKSVVSKLQG